MRHRFAQRAQRALSATTAAAVAATALIVAAATPAMAGGGYDLDDDEAMYVIDGTFTTRVATDVPHAEFAPIGKATLADQSTVLSQPAFDQTTQLAYVVLANSFGTALMQFDPSTGELTRIARFQNQQIFGPNPFPVVTAIAISPTGAMFATDDTGVLYTVAHTADTAVITKVGTTSITSTPIRGLTFDKTDGVLVAFDEATSTLKTLSLSNAATLSTISASNLPPGAGSTVYGLQLDKTTPNPTFWVLSLEAGHTMLYGAEAAAGNVDFEFNDELTDGSENPLSSSALLVAPKLIAPAATPTITGTAYVGQTVTALPGAWDAAASLSYQWQRGGVAIPGATHPTYSLTTADLNQAVSVRVKGTKPGRLPTTRISAAIAPVGAPAPSPAATSSTPVVVGTPACAGNKPRLSGSPTRNATLKTTSCTLRATVVYKGKKYKNVALNPSKKVQKVRLGGHSRTIKLTYTWYAGAKKVASGSKASLKISSALAKRYKGKKVRLVVTVGGTGVKKAPLKSTAWTRAVRR